MSKSKRRFLVPEVVQTSGMDCGPASLKCLLEGFGVSASYGRLREACQTDVDGTSIDTLEEISVQLGLDAEQIMVPVDHLFLPEANTLPAIVVIRRPDGFTHFVVVWRTYGNRLVQVMDPATGRRWPTIQQFLHTVYQHELPVPATGWREWAGTNEFLNPLCSRLKAVGISQVTVSQLVHTAYEDTGWLSLAILDAATRMVQALVHASGVKKGIQAARILTTFIAQTKNASDLNDAPIPEAYWSVRPLASDENGNEQLLLRGAVLVRINGRFNKTEASPTERELPISPELAAALAEPAPRPSLALWRLLRADGLLEPAGLMVALLLTGLGVVVEALLLRGLFDLGQLFPLAYQRLGVMSALLTFSTLLLLMRYFLITTALNLGRKMEIRLRIAFLEKIPRLRDQYFHSRPVSDMAQRSHAIHRLRLVPPLTARFLLTLFTLFFTTVGVIWLSPQNVVLAVALSVLSVAIPLLLQPFLTERDMRKRTHVGALSRFFLDAMIGLVPIRSHGAEKAIRYEHESLLIEWGRAAFSFYCGVVTMTAVQLMLSYSLAIWLLINHVQQGSDADTVLLLVYWLLIIPLLAQDIGLIARQYPILRNTTLRLLEPLGAREDVFSNGLAVTDRAVPTQNNGEKRCGTKIGMEGIGVRAAGHTILQDITFAADAGEHIAIVGQSGAGKSSLVGLLLGWHRPADGTLLVNGSPLNETTLAILRQETVWVDPAVQIWNRTLLENLQFGNGITATHQLTPVLEQAELLSILRKLPEGLQTVLGESGGLVSGGEGQRVRLGRGLLRSNVTLAILDEPFRGLARPQRQRLLCSSRELWQNATLFYISHDVSESLSFNRVLVMDNGRLIEDGSPAELSAQPGSRYAALLAAETKARKTVWGSAKWRKFRLENGKLVTYQGEAE